MTYNRFFWLLVTAIFSYGFTSQYIYGKTYLKKTKKINLSRKKQSKLKRRIIKKKKKAKKKNIRYQSRKRKSIKKCTYSKQQIVTQKILSHASPKITIPYFPQITLHTPASFPKLTILKNDPSNYFDIQTPYTKTKKIYGELLAHEEEKIIQEICSESKISRDHFTQALETIMYQCWPDYQKMQQEKIITIEKEIQNSTSNVMQLLPEHNSNLEQIKNFLHIRNRVVGVQKQDLQKIGGCEELDTIIFLQQPCPLNQISFIIGHELGHIKHYDAFTWSCLINLFDLNENNYPAWYWKYRRFCEKRADIQTALLNKELCHQGLMSFSSQESTHPQSKQNTENTSSNDMNFTTDEHPKTWERQRYLSEVYRDMHNEIDKANFY